LAEREEQLAIQDLEVTAREVETKSKEEKCNTWDLDLDRRAPALRLQQEALVRREGAMTECEETVHTNSV
jgi:hypothetical protein